MKKDLQRLTSTEKKFTWLMEKNKITKSDFSNTLNIKERAIFIKNTIQLINNVFGIDRNLLIEKVKAILPDEKRTLIWENNHYVITESINKLIAQSGIMPTKQQISFDTGISRQTIHKHLNEYTNHSSFKAQKQQFKFMAGKIIAAVIKEASKGDVKAARLYFELVGGLEDKNNKPPIISNQNNNESIHYVNGQLKNSNEN